MSQRHRISRDASLGRDVNVAGLAASDPLRGLKPEVNAGPARKPEAKPAAKSKRKAAK